MTRIVLLSVFLPTVAYTQVNQLWMDYTLQKQMQQVQWSWWLETGMRFQENDGFFSAYSRGTIFFQPAKGITLMSALAWFYYKSSPSRITGHDIRPSQGVRFEIKLPGQIIFSNQLRLEERFLVSSRETELILRFRFQTGLQIVLYRNIENNHTLYLPITFEIFEDVNKQRFINRNRLSIGSGFGFGSNRLELHYLAQQGRFNVEEDFELLESIFRVRWLRTLQKRATEKRR